MQTKGTKVVTAFAGTKKIAHGKLRDVAYKAKEAILKNGKESILIFEDASGAPIDIDFRGTPEAVVRRIDEKDQELEEKKSGPGRPKLGVIPREITLLPQHWEWLNSQPGGASVTIRKLVEEARKKNFAKDQVRIAQEVSHKFMSALAGDLANFEEVLRALYSKDETKFIKSMKEWPKDIRDYATKLAKPVWVN